MDRPVNAAPVDVIARGPGRELSAVIALNCAPRPLAIGRGEKKGGGKGQEPF